MHVYIQLIEIMYTIMCIFKAKYILFLTQQIVNYRLSFFEIPASGLTDDIGSVQIHLGLSWIFLPFSRSSWTFLYVSDDIPTFWL